MHDNTPCDAELMQKQRSEDTKQRISQFKSYLTGKKLLDFGCGAGGFLLEAKNITAQVAGIEPELRLYPYFNEKDLDVYTDINVIPNSFVSDIWKIFITLELLNAYNEISEKNKMCYSIIVVFR